MTYEPDESDIQRELDLMACEQIEQVSGPRPWQEVHAEIRRNLAISRLMLKKLGESDI